MFGLSTFLSKFALPTYDLARKTKQKPSIPLKLDLMIKRIRTSLSLLLPMLVVAMCLIACGSNAAQQVGRTEDTEKKQLLQGVWTNELDGSVVLTVKGDTISFADTLSSPATFHVYGDTLQIDYHPSVSYKISRCTATTFRFFNSEGDEISLTKSTRLKSGNTQQRTAINQQKTIKKDSVIISGQTKYHAYTQVNPTTFKVYRQQTNSDGIQVETTYFDNIVFIALYDGNRKIYGHNIEKKDFKGIIPDTYIGQAILSEIKIVSAAPSPKSGVRFDAILTQPDSYTSYVVHIDISDDGKRTLSI